jgi:hypothetical protein
MCKMDDHLGTLSLKNLLDSQGVLDLIPSTNTMRLHVQNEG